MQFSMIEKKKNSEFKKIGAGKKYLPLTIAHINILWNWMCNWVTFLPVSYTFHQTKFEKQNRRVNPSVETVQRWQYEFAFCHGTYKLKSIDPNKN